jgi:hypothetical protein
MRIIVSEHLDRVHNVVLINVYLDLRNPGRSGFWAKGSTWAGEGTKGSVYEQQGAEVDGSCHSKEGSK